MSLSLPGCPLTRPQSATTQRVPARPCTLPKLVLCGLLAEWAYCCLLSKETYYSVKRDLLSGPTAVSCLLAVLVSPSPHTHTHAYTHVLQAAWAAAALYWFR
jgi:hypothetical protein